MAPLKITEGEVEFSVPTAGKPCKTWYRIAGDLSAGKRPLVALHGGPGCVHTYLLPLEDLVSQHGIPVIFYDQLGNGNSTHLQEKKGDTTFWTEQLFQDELTNLLTKLGVKQEYDLLGQSWGGMLGSAFAAGRPKGLRRLIISNSPASMELWLDDNNKLREALPKDVQDTLLKHEKDGTTESEEYEEAVNVFYERHLCRIVPFPEQVTTAMEWIKKDPTVYHTMNGPSEFHVIGSLKSWSVIDRLHNIEVPTLIINGRYDEAQDNCVAPFFREIPKAKWITLEKSSHMSMFEERERYIQIVGDFLK